MKKLIVYLTIAFISLLQSVAIAAVYEENAPTILKNQDIPRLKLFQSTRSVYSKDEIQPILSRKEIDYKKLKWNTVIVHEENWQTQKGEKEGITIQITRTYLGSHEAARELAKFDVFDYMFKPGSLTGKSIGDVCWSSYRRTDYDTFSAHTYILHFVKGDAVVRLLVGKNIPDPDYIENLARIIISRM